MSIRIASFFSGIGGLELGLEAALAGETVFQCERDPYARAVLERHWPGVLRSDDITALRGDGDIPHAEVWCGGFPCQDISVAGRMEGIRGERSGLFFEWMRLVRAVRPSYVVMENVPAILAGENLGPVLGALAEAGYDAEWDVLGAWQVGAPHRRVRWFLIGWRAELRGPVADADTERPRDAVPAGRYAAGHGRKDELADAKNNGARWRQQQQGGSQSSRDVADTLLMLRDGSSDHAGERPRTEPLSESGDGGRAQDVGDTDSQHGEEHGTEHQLRDAPCEGSSGRPDVGGGGCWWLVEPDVGRVADGVPYRVDRLRCLGNAVVPQCAYVIGLRLREIMESHRATTLTLPRSEQ